MEELKLITVSFDFIVSRSLIDGVILAAKQSEFLLKASVKEVPLDKCRNEINQKLGKVVISSFAEGVTDTLFCARNDDAVTDTCQGEI